MRFLAEEIRDFLEPAYLQRTEPGIRNFGGVGIFCLSRRELETLERSNRKIRIRMLGVLMVGDDVSVELIKKTVAGVQVFGKIAAGPAVMKALEMDRN